MSKGYHITKIPKGVLGEWSKVEEELAEYEDAKEQGSKILMAVELADVWGAIVASNESGSRMVETVAYISNEASKLGLTYVDLMKFSRITERAFKSGARK